VGGLFAAKAGLGDPAGVDFVQQKSSRVKNNVRFH